MSSPLFLTIQPEAAIIQSVGDVPAKARRSGTYQDFHVLYFDPDTQEQALFSWPIPRAADLGIINPDVRVLLHWSSEESSGDVAWLVAFALSQSGDLADLDFGLDQEVAAVSIAGANREAVSILDISGVLESIDDTKTARLVMRLRRKVGIVSNIAGDAYLLPGLLRITTAPFEAFKTIAATSTPAIVDLVGKTNIIQVTGAAIDVTFPEFTEANDGDQGWFIRTAGAYMVQLLAPATYSFLYAGGTASPFQLPSTGDSVRWQYRHSDKTIYLF